MALLGVVVLVGTEVNGGGWLSSEWVALGSEWVGKVWLVVGRVAGWLGIGSGEVLVGSESGSSVTSEKDGEGG